MKCYHTFKGRTDGRTDTGTSSLSALAMKSNSLDELSGGEKEGEREAMERLLSER